MPIDQLIRVTMDAGGLTDGGKSLEAIIERQAAGIEGLTKTIKNYGAATDAAGKKIKDAVVGVTFQGITEEGRKFEIQMDRVKNKAGQLQDSFRKVRHSLSSVKTPVPLTVELARYQEKLLAQENKRTLKNQKTKALFSEQTPYDSFLKQFLSTLQLTDRQIDSLNTKTNTLLRQLGSDVQPERFKQLFMAMMYGKNTFDALTLSEKQAEDALRSLLNTAKSYDTLNRKTPETDKAVERQLTAAAKRNQANKRQQTLFGDQSLFSAFLKQYAQNLSLTEKQMDQFIAKTNTLVGQIGKSIQPERFKELYASVVHSKNNFQALTLEEKRAEDALRSLLNTAKAFDEQNRKPDGAAEKIAAQKLRAEKERAKIAGSFAAIEMSEKYKNMIPEKRSDMTPQSYATLVTRANAAINEIAKIIAKGEVKPVGVDALFNNLKTNGIKSFMPNLTADGRQVENALRNIIRAMDNIADPKRTEAILLSWKSIARIFMVQTIHMVIGKFVHSLIEAHDAAIKLNIKIAETQTISQEASKSTADWATELRNLSDAFGVDILDVAEGAYEALSNQITSAATSTRFMTDALVFAKTTVSSTADSVDLLSSVLNSYKLSTASTERVAATLFGVIELGRVRASEMANEFGNIGAIGKQLNVSLEELGSSIAVLTIRGIKYETASVLITNVMKELLKPTKEMKELFKEWGVESGEAAIASFGLFGVINKLGDELRSGGSTRLAELTDDLRALRGALSLTNESQLLQKNLEELGGTVATVGKAIQKYKQADQIIKNSQGYKAQQELTKISNAFTVDAGTYMFQEFVKANEAFGGLSNVIRDTIEIFKTATSVFSGFLYPLGMTVKVTSMLTSNIAPLTGAITGLGLAYLLLNNRITYAVVSTRALVAATNPILALMTGIGFVLAIRAKAAQDEINIKAKTTEKLNELDKKRLDQINEDASREIKIFELTQAAKIKHLTQLQNVLNRPLNNAADNILIRPNDLFNNPNFKPLAGIEKVLPKEDLKDGEGLLKLFNKQIESTFTIIDKIKKQRLDNHMEQIFKQLDGKNLQQVEQVFKQLEQSARDFANAGLFKMEKGDIKEGRDDLDSAEKIIDRLSKYKIKLFEEANSEIEKALDNIKKIKNEVQSDIFNAKTAGFTGAQKAAATQKQIAVLNKEALQATANGDFDQARAKLEAVYKLNKELVDDQVKLREQFKGTNLGAVDTSGLEKAAKDRIDLETAIKNVNEKKAKDSKKIEENLGNLQNQVNGLRIKAEEDLQKLLQTRLIQETTLVDAQKKQIENAKQLRDIYKEINDRQAALLNKMPKDQTELSGNRNTLAGNLAQIIETFKSGIFSDGAGRNAIDWADPVTVNKITSSLTTLENSYTAYEKILRDSNATEEQKRMALQKTKIEFNSLMAEIAKFEAKYGQDGKDALASADIGGKSVTALLDETSKLFKTVEGNQADVKANEEEKARLDQLIILRDRVLAQHGLDLKAINDIGAASAQTNAQIIADLQKRLKLMQELIDLGNRAVVEGNKVGGPLGAPPKFDFGGLIGGPPGRDNQLIAAHRGEFVVNSGATRKFYSQLVAMNAGYTPRGYNNGGIVNNVGDININMTGAGKSTAAAGREIATVVRRELKRGNVRWS